MSVDFTWAALPAIEDWTPERAQQLVDACAQINSAMLSDKYLLRGLGLTAPTFPLELCNVVVRVYDQAANSAKVGLMELEGLDYSVWITGGVTYGDESPTDLYDPMIAIELLGGAVNDLLLQFAREEFAARRQPPLQAAAPANSAGNSDPPITLQCAVVCQGMEGPDIYFVQVRARMDQYTDGAHYTAAWERVSAEQSVDGPYVVIDERDPGHAILNLCAAWETISLEDISNA
jgi:hypothetical protein